MRTGIPSTVFGNTPGDVSLLGVGVSVAVGVEFCIGVGPEVGIEVGVGSEVAQPAMEIATQIFESTSQADRSKMQNLLP